MKNISLKLLKYLYENDNGDFLDVNKAFNKKDKPTRKRLDDIYFELRDYINYESAYNYSEEEREKVESTDLLRKAKINQKGIEYYLSQKSKINTTRNNKIKLYFAFFGIIIGVLTLLIKYLNTIENHTLINDQNFPQPILCIKNQTNDTIKIFKRQTFILWTPSNRDITGKYELIKTNIDKDVYVVLPSEETEFNVDIDNKEKFLYYFKQNENDITATIKTQNKRIFFSSNLPFKKKWIKKYCMEVIIK